MGRDASIVRDVPLQHPLGGHDGDPRRPGAGLENGTLRPVIGREFPLSAAPESHGAVMSPGARGKIVLLP